MGPKIDLKRPSHLIKHVHCSKGSWIGGNSAVPK